MRCDVSFPSAWVDASAFEAALRASGGPHRQEVYETKFIVPVDCKIMIETAVRLLSLANQLDRKTCSVTLDFEEGEPGTMGYLNRMGFFDHLAKSINVVPARPALSGAEIYKGANADLVEIARINPEAMDKSLPTRLADAVVHACGKRKDVKALGDAAWTVFAELIANIFDHSATLLDGYAAVQLYPRGNSLKVAVSDSGKGIIETLRPVLSAEYPTLDRLSDVDLLVEVFRRGISRHGSDRGCGLKGSADQAIKYKADLDVRLPQSRVWLVPGTGGYRPNTAYCFNRLPLLWGTHICFTFRLD